MDKMLPAKGLRVLITAGASGIGEAIARAFAEADAKVLVCDIDANALERLAADVPGILTVVADVSDEAAVTAMLEDARVKLGGLDVLVNNAGISGPTGRIDTLSVEDIRRTLDIDLLGQFLVVRQAAPLLRQSEAGAIINISSVAGRLGYGLRTPYAASKWGIVGFTQSLAKEMGPDGIRVNAILPGIVRGPRIESVIRARAEAEGISYADMEKQYLANVSLRRMVEPEDVAGLSLFLCAPAGANISGQAISVCGNVENI
ncbi:NAD(P)-dependent dehydrogenase (short-subunit alcohol dehydrogenase family) [Roseibium marinum]|uniref:NAD(P)-dependent dehydrogenase (Short-subunit alcohol dehydrogenase family) n=2 Tax=Roseibium marinum TaxID=281252 RepID=A0A2S3UTB4_9HYPH|nr:NAD(P)-dependent dehydrogenase (short-subunit alcohol dehydrogenase family) [Roseibium marinum]